MTWLFWLLRQIGLSTHRGLRLALRAIALAEGLYCLHFANVAYESQLFVEAAWWHCGVAAAAFMEFVLADVLADKAFPYDTERKLNLLEMRLGRKVIHAMMDRICDSIRSFHCCDTGRISATVHLLTDLDSTQDDRFRQGLLQLTDYVGPDGGKKGRITPITKGVIGLCVRTRQVETVNFSSREEYFSSMTRYYGFTAHEASQHSAKGRSYLAYPLMKDIESVVGVLYFFTSEPQVFPSAVDLAKIEELARHILRDLQIAGLV